VGDPNQLYYLQSRLRRVEGSVLEVGSKDYGSTMPFRERLDYTGSYVGVDMEDGTGVDVVGDLSAGLCGLEPGQFSLVICCSVLEHVQRPWLMADHLTQLMRPGGYLFVAVPWVWRYHGYPEDYYRFSHRGVMVLFPQIEWSDHSFATYIQGKTIPIRDGSDAQAICDRLAVMSATPEGNQKYLPYMQVLMLGNKR